MNKVESIFVCLMNVMQSLVSNIYLSVYHTLFSEGNPEKFSIGVLDNPLRIASPFQVSSSSITQCQKMKQNWLEMQNVCSATRRILKDIAISIAWQDHRLLYQFDIYWTRLSVIGRIYEVEVSHQTETEVDNTELRLDKPQSIVVLLFIRDKGSILKAK